MEIEKNLYSIDCIALEKKVEASENLENKNFKIDFSKAEKFTVEELKIVEDFINQMLKQEIEMTKFVNKKNFSNALKLCDTIKMEIIK